MTWAARATSVALFAIVVLRAALAHAEVRLRAATDADAVEVGQAFLVQVEATTDGEERIGDPKLGPIAGFTVLGGPQLAPTQAVTIINGQLSQRRGVTATWQLRADKAGSFTLGPPSVLVGNDRKSTNPIRVTVVPPGSRPRQRPGAFDPFQGSPFNTWKGLIQNFDDDDDDPRRHAAPPTDPSLGLDAPNGTVAFLHASVDKKRAVIGEQVTLAVYLYEDPYARQTQPTDVHEATASDFVKRSLMEDETHAIGIGNALVAGRPWTVKLVRKTALFPIKAGRLTISPMTLTLPHVRPGLRESETLSVDVAEPPAAGRPAGYVIGDVGDFALEANVTPRSAERGGAVGVTIELRGTGNLPSQLPVPVTSGVEWLEPQVKDKLGAVKENRFGGSRTFSYVVRLQKEGTLDLGEVKVPFYNPQTRAYGVARATLGAITVTPGAVRDGGAEAAEVLLPNLPKERRAFEPKAEATFVTDSPFYWGALFGSPFACVVLLGAQSVLRRTRERRASAAPSTTQIAKTKHAEADQACKGGDAQAAIGAIVSAVVASIVAKTGVNVRGTAFERGVRELQDKGVPEAAADAVVGVLRACEDARFSPEGVTMESARALWARAQKALDAVRGDA